MNNYILWNIFDLEIYFANTRVPYTPFHFWPWEYIKYSHGIKRSKDVKKARKRNGRVVPELEILTILPDLTLNFVTLIGRPQCNGRFCWQVSLLHHLRPSFSVTIYVQDLSSGTLLITIKSGLFQKSKDWETNISDRMLVSNFLRNVQHKVHQITLGQIAVGSF